MAAAGKMGMWHSVVGAMEPLKVSVLLEADSGECTADMDPRGVVGHEWVTQGWHTALVRIQSRQLDRQREG